VGPGWVLDPGPLDADRHPPGLAGSGSLLRCTPEHPARAGQVHPQGKKRPPRAAGGARSWPAGPSHEPVPLVQKDIRCSADLLGTVNSCPGPERRDRGGGGSGKGRLGTGRARGEPREWDSERGTNWSWQDPGQVCCGDTPHGSTPVGSRFPAGRLVKLSALAAPSAGPQGGQVGTAGAAALRRREACPAQIPAAGQHRSKPAPSRCWPPVAERAGTTAVG